MKKQSLVLVVIAAIVVIAGIFFITNQNIQKDVSDDQKKIGFIYIGPPGDCLLYTSPSPRDSDHSRMPSSA